MQLKLPLRQAELTKFTLCPFEHIQVCGHRHCSTEPLQPWRYLCTCFWWLLFTIPLKQRPNTATNDIMGFFSK